MSALSIPYSSSDHLVTVEDRRCLTLRIPKEEGCSSPSADSRYMLLTIRVSAPSLQELWSPARLTHHGLPCASSSGSRAAPAERLAARWLLHLLTPWYGCSVFHYLTLDSQISLGQRIHEVTSCCVLYREQGTLWQPRLGLRVGVGEYM